MKENCALVGFKKLFNGIDVDAIAEIKSML
jgi:hypothetical protein